jgi:hypothetical protein
MLLAKTHSLQEDGRSEPAESRRHIMLLAKTHSLQEDGRSEPAGSRRHIMLLAKTYSLQESRIEVKTINHFGLARFLDWLVRSLLFA